nr:AF4/FMR2 family member 1-like [Drosophila kikkawai]
MDGQGHPPTPAPAPQDNSWMCCVVDELRQALQGAGPSPPRPSDSLFAHSAGLFRPRALPVDATINADNGEETTAGNHAGLRRPSTEGMPPLVPLFAGLVRATSGPSGSPHRTRSRRQQASLGPLGAAYDLVSDDEGRDNHTRSHYDPTGDNGDDSDATVLYDPTAEDSRDIRRRRTTPPHPSDNRAPPYMGEVEAALIECFGEIPVDVFDWGSGTNTASTISADDDEASRDGRQSDASRPPSTGPADDASASTVSADEDETSQDSGWSNAPRSPPPRWTPPSTTPLQSWAPATASRSRPPPPSYEEIFGLRPYPGPHATARCAAVAASRDPRPRLPTIAELAAEEARRRAEDLSEELGIPQMAQLPVGNPPVAQPPSNGPPPSPTPRRRARRRSAPWADSPPSSSDESSLDADEGALGPPRWVPAPVEWTTPNGTLPAALLRRIHGRLATPRRRTIRILEEEANQRFRVQINRSGKVIITLHPSRR